MTHPVDQTSAQILARLVCFILFYFILLLFGVGERGKGHTDLGGIVGGTEYQLRGAVVAGADVGDVGLVGDEDLSTAKVAELENAGAGVKEEVLGFDVTVADALGMDVGERAEQLVCVQLHLEEWHGSLELVEVPRSTVDGLWDVFKHQVEVDLVLLFKEKKVVGSAKRLNVVVVVVVVDVVSRQQQHLLPLSTSPTSPDTHARTRHDHNARNDGETTYSITVGVVKRLELDNVWVTDYAHDLELTILTRKRRKGQLFTALYFGRQITLAAMAHSP